ncbi:MFS transporter [Kitasatospora sp. NPDC088134]|uniref:MFS transporter n=1 Tax=Kitasatospora sp. NPDC088134 TaxID=3364071 RepID=UPI00382DBE81
MIAHQLLAPRSALPARRTATTPAPAAPAPSGSAPVAPAPSIRSAAALPAVLLAGTAAAGISGPGLALPAVARVLQVPVGTAAWLLTGYGLGLVVGTPLMSALARRGGPARMVRLGAVLVALGAAVLLLAPPVLPALLAGRAVEAVGAAGLTLAAFRIAGRDRSGRAAGRVAVGNAVGGIVGLSVGALAAQLLDWRAATVLPLLGLAVVPAALRAARAGEAAPAAPGRVLPLDLLRVPAFRRAAALMLLLATVNFALVYGVPRRIAGLTGWAPLPTALAVSGAALTGALLATRVVRPGQRPAVLAAASLAAAAVAALAPWAAPVAAGSLVSALVTAGGQGRLTALAADTVPAERRGAAIGLFNLAFPLGVAAGPVLASVVDRTVQFIH